MREPLAHLLDPGPTRPIEALLPAVARAARGVEDTDWAPPPWLLPHQRIAGRRLAGALRTFRGGLLADAVGLGKTYVALALAGTAKRPIAVVPAALAPQWRRVADRVRVAISIVTHEALSRSGRIPPADFVIVDEAHRFRNPATRRYDRLARDLRAAPVLLVTATPVVNRAQDLLHLLRLFLPDHALAGLGVPSLQGAFTEERFLDVLHAVAPLIVARDEHTAAGLSHALPAVADAKVFRASPLEPGRLTVVVRETLSLRFPALGPEAPELLRRHLLHRLASSADAFRVSVRRHAAYCRRACDAALRGERLPRAAARQLFGPEDDGQLELLLASAREPLDPAPLVEELDRLHRLEALLADVPRPKEARLIRLLARRGDRKTLIFTTARATALALARALRWQRLAVVTGDAARIASGRITAEEAFTLFAPRARGRPPPHRRRDVAVLIATDLASEGLDLQDADTVVHYDLPWQPVRLAQRVGRLVRLGSLYDTVRVWWFVPPAALERRLGLITRLGDKLDAQLRLTVPTSSGVGRARVANMMLRARERLAALETDAAPCVGGHAPAPLAGTLLALRWTYAGTAVRELLGVGRDGAVLDFERIEGWMRRTAAGSDTAPRTGTVGRAVVAGLVQARLRPLGPTTAAARHIAVRLLRRARRAGAHRELELLALLDEALARVHGGLTEGEERILRDLLRRPRPVRALRRWLASTPVRACEWTGPVPEVVIGPGLAGDSSPH